MPYRSISLNTVLPASAAEYYSQWLAVCGLSHGSESVSAFARAHPFMFGTGVATTARGYDRWLVRSAREDNATSFAEFLARRYERWRSARAAARGGRRAAAPG